MTNNYVSQPLYFKLQVAYVNFKNLFGSAVFQNSQSRLSSSIFAYPYPLLNVLYLPFSVLSDCFCSAQFGGQTL